MRNVIKHSLSLSFIILKRIRILGKPGCPARTELGQRNGMDRADGKANREI